MLITLADLGGGVLTNGVFCEKRRGALGRNSLLLAEKIFTSDMFFFF